MDIVETSDRREHTEAKKNRDSQHTPQRDLDQKESSATGRGRSRIRPSATSGKDPEVERGSTEAQTAAAPRTENTQVPTDAEEVTNPSNQPELGNEGTSTDTSASSDQRGTLGQMGEAAAAIGIAVGGTGLLRALLGESPRNTNGRHR